MRIYSRFTFRVFYHFGLQLKWTFPILLRVTVSWSGPRYPSYLPLMKSLRSSLWTSWWSAQLCCKTVGTSHRLLFWVGRVSRRCRPGVLVAHINMKLRLVAMTVRAIVRLEETIKEFVDNEIKYEFFETSSSFSEDQHCTFIRSLTSQRQFGMKCQCKSSMLRTLRFSNFSLHWRRSALRSSCLSLIIFSDVFYCPLQTLTSSRLTDPVSVDVGGYRTIRFVTTSFALSRSTRQTSIVPVENISDDSVSLQTLRDEHGSIYLDLMERTTRFVSRRSSISVLKCRMTSDHEQHALLRDGVWKDSFTHSRPHAFQCRWLTLCVFLYKSRCLVLQHLIKVWSSRCGW